MSRNVKYKAMAIINGKNGSAVVMLAIIFVGFALCMVCAIGTARRLVVNSECESFGRVWNKAVLSEYDVHLLEDFSIMAYFGNDSDVSKKLGHYLNYSLKNKMDERIKGVNADLSGLELGDPSNFRKAIKLGFSASAASEFINGRGRIYRGLDNAGGYEEEGRVINNKVVLDTLPSSGSGGSISADTLTVNAKSIGDENSIKDKIAGAGSEILLIEKCFDNHVTAADENEHFMVNEWEYIIKGSNDDEANYRACRRKLFLARNALNLIALYKDEAKVEAVITVAEAITPGPLGAATQVVIAEAWAALETEEDLDDLYNDRRVPIIKTAEQWKTSLGALIDSKELDKKLSDDSKGLLSEKREEIDEVGKGVRTVTQFKDGLNYDEYLMIMILAMNENTRLLRIMDLVQINMKYRYYRDFNLMEYYIGTRFSIDEGFRSHVFEETYK